MPLTLTQVAVTGTPGPLVTVPLGSTVTLVASAAAHVGTDAGVTVSTGFLLPANVPVPLTLTDYSGQPPVTLYGVNGGSGTVSVALSA